MKINHRTILITGGSSGIGAATCDYFAQKGWSVFELSRHGHSAPSITHIDCDVCDEQSVQNAIVQVLSLTDHIDVVISNAGYGISGPIECTPIEQVTHQMDVNFIGAIRFTQAVLPQLRKQRYGRIIYTSSVAASLAVPYQAFYSASKAAINAVALALANELRDWNISVSVLMPGDVKTGFTNARKKSIVDHSLYPRAEKAITIMEHDEQNGMEPILMAKLFYRIATCRSPKPQYIGGTIYRLFCFLDRILPKRFVNWLEYKVYS
jgi:NAD(P)-dependent dehydrogenase (short-subunit alcohol dehydrogenase family)